MLNKYFPHPLKLIIGFVLIITLLIFTNLCGLSFNWGRLVLAPTSTITVIGEAKKEQLNQLAEFNAGIEVIAEDKNTATDQANQIMNNLIEKIKAYGIEEKDLQTNRINVYQEDEYLDPNRRTKTTKKGDWRASLNLTITLRVDADEDLADKSEGLLAILNTSEINHISGPNFRLDNTQNTDIDLDLLKLAVTDARTKAEAIANANQQKVKKIINLVEGYNANPIKYDISPLTAGKNINEQSVAQLEPGSSTTQKIVTVTFELK